MFDSVFRKTIWDRKSGFVWWVVGLLAITGVTVAFWPTLQRDSDALMDLMEGLPEGMLNLFGAEEASAFLTGPGFVNSRVFASVGSFIAIFFAISMGTAAIAGEEDKRTLDLLLATPTPRDRIVLESFAAQAVLTTVLATVVWIALLVADPLLDIGLSVTGVTAASIGMALLALSFGSLALMIGALTGNRSLTVGVTAGVTIATFFINGLAPLIDSIAWTQKLTPFYWLLDHQPLVNGFQWQPLVLVAAIVVFVGIALWGFRRRDVTV
ncbi:MAG: ABC transporter permease subunit [bacterium]|nr:ABC transporter permease subunit [bacterium]